MDELRDRARKAVQRLGQRGRTTKIPNDVREAVLAYAQHARDAGATWQRIAEEVGLSASVLMRWAQGRRRARGRLVPVRLLARPSEQPPQSHARATLIAPNGYRIEGLSVAEAVDLLRALA